MCACMCGYMCMHVHVHVVEIAQLLQDRKVIVKSLKGVVCKVCREENGHVVMMGMFDCVDDTVLVNKVVLAVS